MKAVLYVISPYQMASEMKAGGSDAQLEEFVKTRLLN